MCWHKQARRWSAGAGGGGQHAHLVKIARCRFALRRFASFITARSISTSLRLAFCRAGRDMSANAWVSCSLKYGLRKTANPTWPGL